MSLSTFTSTQLAQVVGLIKEKEALQIRLSQIDATLTALEGGKAAPKKSGRKPGRPPGAKAKVVAEKAGRRGQRLKAPMLKLLSAAGPSGITVKELSAKLKVKPGNIFSWFYTTGKKIKGIAKVGEAKYAYST